METLTIARKAGQSERRAEDRLDARWPGQRHVIRAAQIAFGGSAFDCVLLDTSHSGARVHLLATAEVPGIATLRLGSGEAWTVQRRWQRGAEVGFKVVGTATPPAITSKAAGWAASDRPCPAPSSAGPDSSTRHGRGDAQARNQVADGAPSAHPLAPLRHTEQSDGEERQQRSDANGRALLAVAALHLAALTISGAAFVAAGVTVWLG